MTHSFPTRRSSDLSGQDAFTIFAQDMGRTGYVNGTLAVREGLRAPVPAVAPRPIMTMADMAHGGMGGGHDMSSMSGASMAGMDHGATTAKDRKSTRLTSSPSCTHRMPPTA